MTACPNCSAAALGTEAAAVCTECAGISIVGATFSLPAMIAGAVCVAVLALAWRAARRAWLRAAVSAPVAS